MLAKNACDKYRKNRQNNKRNKILDLKKEETKKGSEMSANIAKVTRIFHGTKMNYCVDSLWLISGS